MSRLHSLFIFPGWLLLPFPAIAQIIPDNTLVGSPSQVLPDTINNLPSERISGGAIRGNNLFHSFQEFNVNSGRGAYFDNPNGITNIFGRVTGNNSSNIFGTLGVLGNANLFLINPKGIVFGPEARLDLRGSFFATTADSVVFDNGFEFSASHPQNPVLTVNIPVGLQFRENPGTIVNQSQVAAPSNPLAAILPLPIVNNPGLAVEPGQTLGLIGGDIELNGGNLAASSGQIILGSVTSPGLVSFAPTPFGLSMNYENIQTFGKIKQQNSLVNTSGGGGGKVDIMGGDVTINGGGIYALTLGNIDGRGIEIKAQNLQVGRGGQIFTLALGDGAGGDINIYANDSLELSGLGFSGFQNFVFNSIILRTIDPFDPQIVLSTGTSSTGAAGNIRIDTGLLLMNNGSTIVSATLGAGQAGNLTIHTPTFELIGAGIISSGFIGSSGRGGDIIFDGERFLMSGGAGIASATVGEGDAGNLTINATESVVLRDEPTLIATSSIDQNTAKAGDVTINTQRFLLSEGAGITLSSGGIFSSDTIWTNGGPGGNLTINATESVEISGNSVVAPNLISRVGWGLLTTDTFTNNRGGDIRIFTPVLTLRQALISAGGLGTGDAGNITIKADRLELMGMNGRNSSLIQADIGNLGGIPNPNATGNAGELNLNVQQLILRDSSSLNVQGFGQGQAGNINIVGNTIILDNNSTIDGTTASGSGANINLQARDILLRRQSRISSDAGSSDGGNITLNGEILVVFPGENSDITANARTAQGGRVTLNVANIFGLAAVTREQLRTRLGLSDSDFAVLSVNPTTLLQTSDIAAISQTAGPQFQGTVTFSTSGVNPAQGLVELAANVVDPGVLIAANPCTAGEGSEFAITGKGGVAPSADEVLSDQSTEYSWVEPAVTSGGVTGESGLPKTPDSDSQMVLARGWVRNSLGEVMLVGYNPNRSFSDRHPQSSGICLPR